MAYCLWTVLFFPLDFLLYFTFYNFGENKEEEKGKPSYIKLINLQQAIFKSAGVK